MQAGTIGLEGPGVQSITVLDPHRQKLHLAENAEPEEPSAV